MIMANNFTIERIDPDGTYHVIWRGKSYDKAEAMLKSIKSDLRHELWEADWINTVFGFAPIAWIN
jgi:hypothetical protein